MADRREQDAIVHWLAEVSRAAATFERRWTWGALRRLDGELAAAMDDQKRLFDQATITGTGKDVEVQGAATVRGWNACVKAMEAAEAPDDAYAIGLDLRTGFRVAIGHQRAAADRVAEIHGRNAVFVTPDEVAAVLASVESFKAIAAIKQFFPGAEMLDCAPGETARGDSGLEAVA